MNNTNYPPVVNFVVKEYINGCLKTSKTFISEGAGNEYLNAMKNTHSENIYILTKETVQILASSIE
jgi:hypothetical protein